MKKIMFLLFALMLASKAWPQKRSKPINYVKRFAKNDTLRVAQLAGDMSYAVREIRIFRLNGSYIVERHGDTLFLGTSHEPVWRKPLTQKSIRDVNRYIHEVKNQTKPDLVSSAIEAISVVVRGDTLAKYKGDFRYGFSIEEQLFKEEYQQFTAKRQLRLDRLKQLFQGIFYPGTVTGDSAGRYLYLSREYQPEASYSPDCIWEFSPERDFKNGCQNFNFKFSNDSFSIFYGKYELQIGFGMYEIIEITPKSILLKNAYSSQKTPPRY